MDLVLNPRRKLTYVEAAWEPERIESNMLCLRKIVSLIHVFFFGTQCNTFFYKYLKYHGAYYASENSQACPPASENPATANSSRHTSLPPFVYIIQQLFWQINQRLINGWIRL
jgi:hypothetical protein